MTVPASPQQYSIAISDTFTATDLLFGSWTVPWNQMLRTKKTHWELCFGEETEGIIKSGEFRLKWGLERQSELRKKQQWEAQPHFLILFATCIPLAALNSFRVLAISIIKIPHDFWTLLIHEGDKGNKPLYTTLPHQNKTTFFVKCMNVHGKIIDSPPPQLPIWRIMGWY